jgi:hypothetical protein
MCFLTGPFIEAKEGISGIIFIEAKDLQMLFRLHKPARWCKAAIWPLKCALSWELKILGK